MANPGLINGKHFTTYVDEVKQLKREKRFEDAEKLLISLVDATESESHANMHGVGPWYYEQLAIIYRKYKDISKELAILERFASQAHAQGVMPEILMTRLAKVRSLK